MLYWSFILLFYVLPCGSQTINDSIIKITAPEITAHAGKKGQINVYVSVKKGYHIQADKVNDEFIIPTSIEIDNHEYIKTGVQVFPREKKFKLEGTSDYLLVYDGVFKITIPFKVHEKIKKGKYLLDSKLHYQACDAKTCFFPKTVVFSVIIKVI